MAAHFTNFQHHVITGGEFCKCCSIIHGTHCLKCGVCLVWQELINIDLARSSGHIGIECSFINQITCIFAFPACAVMYIGQNFGAVLFMQRSGKNLVQFILTAVLGASNGEAIGGGRCRCLGLCRKDGGEEGEEEDGGQEEGQEFLCGFHVCHFLS